MITANDPVSLEDLRKVLFTCSISWWLSDVDNRITRLVFEWPDFRHKIRPLNKLVIAGKCIELEFARNLG